MPPKLRLDLPVRSFPTTDDFRDFLELEHATAPGIHLKFAKKSSGVQSISPSDAIETALCYGWIDGRANSLDENWWLVRYTPRRAKSIWSKKNVETVGRLIEEGRMEPAGMIAVESAKSDGRWDRAYAGPATIEVSKEFSEALKAMPTADAFFKSLNKTDRYSVLWRIETASEKSRSGRIDAIVQGLAVGKIPGVRKR